MGEGAYYDPQASHGSLKHNHRYRFLAAIQKRTPEVLTALRYRVWPQYDRLYWRVRPCKTLKTWRYTINPDLAISWMAEAEPKNWTPYANRSLKTLKRRLFLWSQNFQVHSEWMLMVALDTMLTWTIYESSPSRQINEAKIDRDLTQLFKLDLSTIEEDEKFDSRHYTWETGPKWCFPEGPDQQFIYPGWHGQAAEAYEREIRAKFDEHLSQYMRGVSATAATLPKIPRVRPEIFEMLALYLCRDMNRKQIASAGFNKDLTVIYRNIRKAAEMVDLPLKAPGRSSQK